MIEAPVYVNARFLCQPITGVQRFAEQISMELKKLDPAIRFVCHKGVLRPEVAERLEVVETGRLTGQAWEQIELPAFLRKRKAPLLLSLCSTGPVAYANQVFTHHDITYVRHPESFSFAFRMLYSTLIPALARRSQAVITVSEFSKNELVGHLRVAPEKVHVVSNAVDDRFGQADVSSGIRRPYFLAVSSNSSHKNFEGLVEAYRRLPDRADVDLRIVGGYSSTLRQKRISPPEGAVFMGRCTDDELIELYRGAMAFVFPSFYEGFGIPPLEAQACGTPVLASTGGAIPEVLRDSALYFDPADTNAITLGMSRLIRDADLRRDLSDSGSKNVSRFSWSASAAAVHQLLLSLQCR